MCNKTDGNSLGYGFVCFSSEEDAQKAMDEMHNRNTDIGTLYVNFAEDKTKREVELDEEFRLRNLYINHLHPSVDDQALREAFQPFGRIVSLKVWISYLLILL